MKGYSLLRSLRFIGIFLFSLTFIPELYAIEGKCIPTPPCYCNEECFKCGPGGCSKPSSPSYQQRPSIDYEAESRRQKETLKRQQEAEQREAERRDRERKKREAENQQNMFEQDKQDALHSMKGITKSEPGLKGTDAGDLGLKEIGDTKRSAQDLKNMKTVSLKSDKPEKLQKGWQKVLGCVMEDVYTRAESLGSVGVSFSQELRNEMKHVFNEVGTPVKEKNSENIASLFLDKPTRSGDFIVAVAVHNNDDGNVVIDVQSYFSKSKGKKDKRDNLQTILILDKYGKLIEGHESASAKVNACLSR
jgi:hypothetical protein